LLTDSPPKGRNLAGIIPLSGRKDSLNLPWPDYLQPLGEDFLALERSVHECAVAGCDSIWIVCNDDVSPIVRKRIGDYVMSPRFFEEKAFVKRKDYHEKWVPIYYTPIAQKDRRRRDSLGWSALHGALTAFLISDSMSQWTRPSKYFVSFPYGIYDPLLSREHRSIIRGPESFYFSHKGSTVRSNKYLGFTFFPEDWPKFKWNIKKQCTGGDRSIPPSERWSGKDFCLKKIFNLESVQIDNKVEIEQYYELESWGTLREYYSSNLDIKKPGKWFMKPYIFKRKDNE